jgi:hypothetical protein
MKGNIISVFIRHNGNSQDFWLFQLRCRVLKKSRANYNLFLGFTEGLLSMEICYGLYH